MDSEQNNQTDNNTQLITELHAALNKVTALFVSFNGFEYHCVKEALQVLEKSSRIHSLPIRAVLAEKIDEKDWQHIITQPHVHRAIVRLADEARRDETEEGGFDGEAQS